MKIELIDLEFIAQPKTLPAAAPHLVDAIIQMGGLMRPLVLRQTGMARYEVIAEFAAFAALSAAAAREPMRLYSTYAFVAKGAEEEVRMLAQIAAL